MRFLTSTRGRLAAAWVVIFAVALGVADLGVYLAVSFATSGAVDAELHGQAAAVSAALRSGPGGRPEYPGDLPHETAGGLLVDLAVIGSDGVLLQTPDQPLDATTLRSLAGTSLGSGRPSMVDFTDAMGVRRRAYATPVAAIPDRSAVLVATTALTDANT